MTDYRVRMSDRFLEAAIMGAIEAYCHGDGFQTEIETIGPIWGHRRVVGDEQIRSKTSQIQSWTGRFKPLGPLWKHWRLSWGVRYSRSP